MKTFSILFSMLFMFSIAGVNSLSGQCIADAGEDLGVCIDSEGNFSPPQLGTQISGGTPPFTFRWEANHPTGLQSTPIYTASHFLEDTTVANPTFIDGVVDDSGVIFHVIVEDSSGIKCRDSVSVTFSSFLVFALEMKTTIQRGETTNLFPNVDGDIPPISITWSPDYNISDVNFAFPEVWPDTTTCYELTIEDGLGCVYDQPLCFLVIVDSTTNVVDLDNAALSLRVFPNPTTDYLQILGLENYEVEDFRIVNMQGKIIRKGKLTQDQIEVTELESGNYILVVSSTTREAKIPFIKL